MLPAWWLYDSATNYETDFVNQKILLHKKVPEKVNIHLYSANFNRNFRVSSRVPYMVSILIFYLQMASSKDSMIFKSRDLASGTFFVSNQGNNPSSTSKHSTMVAFELTKNK